MGFRVVSSNADMTTPVAQRSKDGIFVGHDGSAWLYRVLPNDALQWEDSDIRQAVARRLMTMFSELGMHSRLGAPGLRTLRNSAAMLKEFHLLRIAQDVAPKPPAGNPPEIAEWQRGVFSETQIRFNKGMVAFGVRLRRSSVATRKGVTSLLGEMADSVIGQEIDLSPYSADRTLMHGIIARAGGRIPTREEADMLEFWWNGGRRGMDSTLTPTPDGRWIGCSAWGEGLEFSALIDFDDAQMDPRRGLWLNDVFSVSEGCVCVSVRGSVYPSDGVRALFRKTRRKAREQMDEQMATGDVDRGEDVELAVSAESLEEYYRSSNEPVLRNVSILFARPASESSHSYKDHLESQWGLTVKGLEHRQFRAFKETLPCGPSKFRNEKPFSHDISIGTLAASGVTSFSDIGDEEGIWLGTALSDMAPIWLDPGGASKANTPPAMAVVGESGSGKTFLLQWISDQCVQAGYPVVFVNPKPADSLSGFALAAGGETIMMSNTIQAPGALDPFRFARTPQDAVAIAASHIKSILDFNTNEELRLDAGMRRATDAGARCVWDALRDPMISDETRENIEHLCLGEPLFAQGVAMEPRPRMGLIDAEAASRGRGGLTLVEFDRQLSLPSSMDGKKTREERIGMASVRLVCNAALESMFAAGGGVLILDEAHVLMGSQEGRKIVTRLGREGRSQRILPILATQLLADIMEGDANMVSHLSRVCVLKMRDPRESHAALQLLRLEATEERVEWLSDAGPIRGVRGSLGFFRDLQDRVSAFTVGPVPKSLHDLYSTNPIDRAEEGDAVVNRFKATRRLEG